MGKKYLIVGAGFSGAVLAEQLSKKAGVSVVIIDERNHIGGNCYTETDAETGIMEHQYGPHIFNTDSKDVWDYVSQFCKMMPYTNRVKAVYHGEVYSIPVNLHTINQFFKKSLNPGEAKLFIESLGDRTIEEPGNFEEQALKTIGADLYNAFYYHYTNKQWGCDPVNVPLSVLDRLPVRFDYNDNYYSTLYQGIPEDGYTAVFEKMLNHPRIEVRLNTSYNDTFPSEGFDHVFYTGPIDAFFNYRFGRLGYRTVWFEKGYADGDFQGNAVINFTDNSVPWTRIHEHKHFTPWKNYKKTIYFREYSRETGKDDIPFYPKRFPEDMAIFEKYQSLTRKLKGVTFSGRLATYRYMDMHHVIEEALEIAGRFK
jgi:UDP-galactopyranose mutase